ncbi:hypothetical protein [Luteipulveratus halotolerans]|uniref:Uncharacterized protein n=1 Tax=Luteipulveratus halotolerans TaxID=1631356 RepID=A0A0L6CJW5_9MICO|nr:hypothetical protein [Luteipulveratus halotolerans]KNX38077.1 hypothetical protein VV01_14490 [Luteipulveratus halotolerans]
MSTPEQKRKARLVKAAIPTATQLVTLVRDDTEPVHEILTSATTEQLYALVVVLAAMVPDDRSVADLLDWTRTDVDRASDLRRTGQQARFRNMPRIVHANEDDWTDDELRAARSACERGDTSEWATEGRRVYYRVSHRRRRARVARALQAAS